MQIEKCNGPPPGTDADCAAAQDLCNRLLFTPLSGIWDEQYVPALKNDPFPPRLETYLRDPTVTSAIGSMTTWFEESGNVNFQFSLTGDWMRTTLPVLEQVIDADVRTVIYAGDADYIVNYKGVEAMVRARSLRFSLTAFRIFRPLH